MPAVNLLPFLRLRLRLRLRFGLRLRLRFGLRLFLRNPAKQFQPDLPQLLLQAQPGIVA
jgi:hypothetical protein